jgi:two-component system sensor histidine kinase ChiS
MTAIRRLAVACGLGLGLMLASALCLAAEPAKDLRFKRLLSEDGISIGAIETVYQDSHGYMWFGGDAGIGLVQYDGHEAVTYSHVPDDPRTLSSNMVWDVLEDTGGHLWLATDGGLDRFNRATGDFTRFHLPTDPPGTTAFARAIVEDDAGNLWIGTFNGLFRLDAERQRFQRYGHDPDKDNSLRSNLVRTLLMGQDGDLWIGTEGGGLHRLDLSTQKFMFYNHEQHNPNSLLSTVVANLYQTQDGMIWVATDRGLNRLDPETGDLRHFKHSAADPSSLSNDDVRALVEDKQGNLWVGTGRGLNVLNRKTGQFKVYHHHPDRPSSLAGSGVRSLYLDAHDNLWIGNFPAGVSFLASTQLAFKTYRHDPESDNTLNQSSVLSLYQDDNGNLLVGTDGGGLNILDRDTDSFRFVPHNPNDPQTLSAGAVLSIEPAKDQQWWLGTWAGGLNLYDPGRGTFKHYHPDNGGTFYHVWTLLTDSEGTLWAGTVGGGVNRYDAEADKFIWYQPQEGNPESMPSYVVWSLFEDHQGDLWLGTNDGLTRYLPETDGFAVYKQAAGDPVAISHDVVTHMAEDDQKRLWIATRGGGLNLYHRETDTFSHLGTEDGLPSEVIASVVPDDHGNLWLGTANGLSRYTPATGQVVNYHQSHGLQGNQFNFGSGIKLNTGELAFGGIRGLTVFDPEQLAPGEHVPPVEIVEFEIFNQPVPVGPNSPLTQTISTVDTITLTHEHSVFSFNLAVLSYVSPNRNQYAYMLEGFDGQWNYVGNRRNATYTNLDPGRYVFRVKGANSQGIWNEEGRSVEVIILPPPWRTWWAYLLYLFTAVGVIAAFVWAQHKKVVRERAVSQRLQQLDKLKDEFMANTSHELRTPLNGIIGLAESLILGAGGPQSEASAQNLSMIVASGKRLDRLVNDILDFSQLKENSLTLRQKSVDMRALAQVVLTLSEPLVGDKPVRLVNAIDDSLPQALADEDRVQQVLHNLLGNAIKFTHEGTVELSAQLVDSNFIEISVKDSGIGIPAEALPYVFDAFQQVHAADRGYGGTGLGLAVTKQLVTLHGGDIRVASTPGEGSVFSFTLPLAEPAEGGQTVRASTPDQQARPQAVEALPLAHSLSGVDKPRVDDEPETETAPERNSRWHLLVVDDEPVNRQVLLNHLQLQHYRVSQAANGKEALELMADQHFDMVLLDVMMPQLSGYEICKELRKSYSSHELPIIFLTAKSQVNDLVAGFNLGANDFLTKPISREELLARVRTHLDLLEINRELEHKVVERTEELRTKHHELEEAYQRLEDISLSDPLTGLNNRRYLQKVIPMDIAKVQREHDQQLRQEPVQEIGHDFVFLLLDVDHFKPVNDIYGHSAGDQLLVQLSSLLARVSRESDCLVRWGGEEFLVVSRFSRREQAWQLAERIRKAVADCDFTLVDGQVLKKTCSIGYACYPFKSDQPQVLTWEQVIDTADKALYAAKKSGRNRCVGITETDKTPSEQLYQRISQDIESLIKQGEVGVVAQDPEGLVWE